MSDAFISAMKMVISGVVGTFGFAIIFGVKAKRLPYTTLGSLLICVVYVITLSLGTFASNAIASFAVTIYCEAIARQQKAPVVVFLTPSLIPLVPGGSLYNTVSTLIYKQYDKSLMYGLQTCDTCLGIAAGILLASLCASLVRSFADKVKVKRSIG